MTDSELFDFLEEKAGGRKVYLDGIGWVSLNREDIRSLAEWEKENNVTTQQDNRAGS